MNKQTRQLLILMAAIVFVASFPIIFVQAEPEGATVQWVTNSTKSGSTPQSRNDTKGSITTILLSTVQQDNKWKAYVGNVSGTLVLRDADDYSIYEWPSGGSPSGEVYISRNNSIAWSTIRCANDTSITNEQVTLGHTATASDNINNTYLNRIHANITVGETEIGNSTCKSLVTWVNNSQQTQTESALFQEVLLMDSSMHVVYTSVINQNVKGYRNDSTNTTYDFQALVPDYTGATTATYYFYVEITG